MKKLLLTSIVMIGISSFATAQNAEQLRQKREAAKKETTQPALVSPADAATQAKVVIATTEKTDAEVATTEAEATKSNTTDDIKAAKLAEQKKTATPAAKKVKGN